MPTFYAWRDMRNHGWATDENGENVTWPNDWGKWARNYPNGVCSKCSNDDNPDNNYAPPSDPNPELHRCDVGPEEDDDCHNIASTRGPHPLIHNEVDFGLRYKGNGVVGDGLFKILVHQNQKIQQVCMLGSEDDEDEYYATGGSEGNYSPTGYGTMTYQNAERYAWNPFSKTCKLNTLTNKPVGGVGPGHNVPNEWLLGSASNPSEDCNLVLCKYNLDHFKLKTPAEEAETYAPDYTPEIPNNSDTGRCGTESQQTLAHLTATRDTPPVPTWIFDKNYLNFATIRTTSTTLPSEEGDQVSEARVSGCGTNEKYIRKDYPNKPILKTVFAKHREDDIDYTHPRSEWGYASLSAPMPKAGRGKYSDNLQVIKNIQNYGDKFFGDDKYKSWTYGKLMRDLCKNVEFRKEYCPGERDFCSYFHSTHPSLQDSTDQKNICMKWLDNVKNPVTINNDTPGHEHGGEPVEFDSANIINWDNWRGKEWWKGEVGGSVDGVLTMPIPSGQAKWHTDDLLDDGSYQTTDLMHDYQSANWQIPGDSSTGEKQSYKLWHNAEEALKNYCDEIYDEFGIPEMAAQTNQEDESSFDGLIKPLDPICGCYKKQFSKELIDFNRLLRHSEATDMRQQGRDPQCVINRTELECNHEKPIKTTLTSGGTLNVYNNEFAFTPLSELLPPGSHCPSVSCVNQVTIDQNIDAETGNSIYAPVIASGIVQQCPDGSDTSANPKCNTYTCSEGTRQVDDAANRYCSANTGTRCTPGNTSNQESCCTTIDTTETTEASGTDAPVANPKCNTYTCEAGTQHDDATQDIDCPAKTGSTCTPRNTSNQDICCTDIEADDNCITPSPVPPGYNITGANGNLSKSNFSIRGITCANGYNGTPVATACTTENEPYILSGCTSSGTSSGTSSSGTQGNEEDGDDNSFWDKIKDLFQGYKEWLINQFSNSEGFSLFEIDKENYINEILFVLFVIIILYLLINKNKFFKK